LNNELTKVVEDIEMARNC